MRRILYRVFIGLVSLILGVPLVFYVWALMRETKSAKDFAPENGMFVTAADVDLFVQTAGEKGNPPIFLIHGMASWSETWRPVMEALAADGWYVVAVDMPPFGFSERPEDYSFWRADQAKRLSALIRALGYTRATVVAHSYGSRAGLETAMQYPEDVRSLVLIDPALSGVYGEPPAAEPGFVYKALGIRLFRDPLTASSMTNPLLARRLLQLYIHDPADATDAIMEVYQTPSRRTGTTRDFGFWLYGFMGGNDAGKSSVVENYKKISIPVSLIWGEEDTTTPLWQGEKLKGMIPNATLTVMEGVGHIPQIEDTDAFIATLRTVLRNQ